jgi:hypothetical protein
MNTLTQVGFVMRLTIEFACDPVLASDVTNFNSIPFYPSDKILCNFLQE